MLVSHQPIELMIAGELDHRLPPAALGEVLRLIHPTVRSATRMAVEGRSTAKGRRPRWLDAAVDIRLENIELLDDRTMLHFVAPTLGEAAAELYEQQEFWSTRPDPLATAIDLFADVLDEIARTIPTARASTRGCSAGSASSMWGSTASTRASR